MKASREKASSEVSSHVTDHLANERTFLAWFRSAVAMMGFGIVIVRLRELAPPNAPSHRPVSLVHLGMFFAVIGLTMMPFALWHYLEARRAIEAGVYQPAFWSVIVFAIVLIALGLLVVIGLASTSASTLANPVGSAAPVAATGFAVFPFFVVRTV